MNATLDKIKNKIISGPKTIETKLNPHAKADFFEAVPEEKGSEVIYRLAVTFSDGDFDRAERRVDVEENHQLGTYGALEIIDELRESLLARRRERLGEIGSNQKSERSKIDADARVLTVAPNGIRSLGVTMPAMPSKPSTRPPVNPARAAAMDHYHRMGSASSPIVAPNAPTIKNRNRVSDDRAPTFVCHTITDVNCNVKLVARLLVNGVLIDSETVPLMVRSPHDPTRAEIPATDATFNQVGAAHLDEQSARLESLLLARHRKRSKA